MAGANGRFAYFPNPGNGPIQDFDLQELEMIAVWKVGGTPTSEMIHDRKDKWD